jgi:uncharacterized tellurite resistance protein B-like protein
MIYVGTSLQAIDGYGDDDPALINPELQASAEQTDRGGENLDYWPAYSQIPPPSRGAYLDWLASGRREPGYDIGYVFLFFYGIERRLLFDAPRDADAKREVPALLEELQALRATYGPNNHSFNGYCERLIGYARRAFGQKADLAAPRYEGTPDERYRMSIEEELALGRMVAAAEPIPTDWALAWVRGGAQVRLRTPGRRCREAFDLLFRRRYNERFGNGLVLEASRAPMTVKYRTASGGIRRELSKTVDGAVDVRGLEAPGELQEFVTEIEEDLEPYSRWIGRRDDRESLAALGQLPQELIRKRAGDDARKFARQVETWLDGGERVVIPSEWLVERWPSKNDGRLTKTEAEALVGLLAGFGFGIEPDVRHTRNPSKRDHVTIFRLRGDDKPPGETFEAARLLVHLAAAVAAADEEVAPGEEERIEAHLEDALELRRSERTRLRAHLERLLRHPPTLRGVRRRADELSSDERRRLATFLLTVAGADGHLEGEEITVLEKIYDILGLEAGQVHRDLHSLSARAAGRSDEGPVTVIEAEREDHYALPEADEEERGKEGSAPSRASEGLSLDLGRVAAVQEETKDVARVLGDIFADDEEGPPSFSIKGLTAAHEALLAELGAQSEWPRAEFDALAEDHGLMPGFAIEQINGQAFEHAEEPLLEGDDPIEINPYALEALRS